MRASRSSAAPFAPPAHAYACLAPPALRLHPHCCASARPSALLRLRACRVPASYPACLQPLRHSSFGVLQPPALLPHRCWRAAAHRRSCRCVRPWPRCDPPALRLRIAARGPSVRHRAAHCPRIRLAATAYHPSTLSRAGRRLLAAAPRALLPFVPPPHPHSERQPYEHNAQQPESRRAVRTACARLCVSCAACAAPPLSLLRTHPPIPAAAPLCLLRAGESISMFQTRWHATPLVVSCTPPPHRPHSCCTDRAGVLQRRTKRCHPASTAASLHAHWFGSARSHSPRLAHLPLRCPRRR
jgi:hypothetical protein